MKECMYMSPCSERYTGHFLADERLNLTNVLFSQNCLNKVPLTRWLKTTETYCLTILEARSPKSRGGQGYSHSKTCRGGLSCLQSLVVCLATFRIPLLVDLSLQPSVFTLCSLCVSLLCLPSVNVWFVSKFSLLQGQRAILDQAAL